MTPYEELTERWPKVLQSALWRAGGFLAPAGFPGAAALSAIRTEAADALRDSERQEWPEPKPSDWRGGQPQRFLGGVTAGPRMNEMFARRETVAMLRGLLGANLRCAGGGSLTVYERPGDRLGLHRDIETCDVTLVTCIWEEGERREGVLRVSRVRSHCALSLIPADRASRVARSRYAPAIPPSCWEALSLMRSHPWPRASGGSSRSSAISSWIRMVERLPAARYFASNRFSVSRNSAP